MSERWVPVPDFEDRYDVSSLGRIKSHYRNIYLRPAKNSVGYLYCILYKNKRTRTVALHRIMLEAFTGTRGKGLEAAHKNGDKYDNRIDNLYWATRQQNAKDKITHKCMPHGMNSHKAKLNDDQVLAIRLARKRGERAAKIAARFKISTTHVYSICNLDSWAHLQSTHVESGD